MGLGLVEFSVAGIHDRGNNVAGKRCVLCESVAGSLRSAQILVWFRGVTGSHAKLGIARYDSTQHSGVGRVNVGDIYIRRVCWRMGRALSPASQFLREKNLRTNGNSVFITGGGRDAQSLELAKGFDRRNRRRRRRSDGAWQRPIGNVPG